MEILPKCIMLPIDGTDESIRPVEFLSRLYPRRDHINLVLSYFLAPLAPIYRQKPDSPEMAARKRQLIRSREEDTRTILNRARSALVEAGFPEELIQEDVQEKAMSVARHACHIADLRKVDAVVLQKRVSSSLEGFLKGDPTHALLHHCVESPIWFTDGLVDPLQAAICIQDEEASLRGADHASFMLLETRTRIHLLHVTRSITIPISSPAFEHRAELRSWLATPEGKGVEPFLMDACQIIKGAGIAEERARITILPGKGRTASEILSHCREAGIGIIVLGHSSPEGVWGFLKGSVTKSILTDFRNMAVWVTQ